MKYTLGLFKILLNKKPIGLNQEIISKHRQIFDNLSKNAKHPDEIEHAMIDFGMELWPYLQAELEFGEKYGKNKKRELFLSLLSDNTKNNWLMFEKDGGDLHNFRKGADYENRFTADEDMEIEKAVIDSGLETKKYLNELAQNEKVEEYSILINKYSEQKKQLLLKINELDELKNKSEKWKQEIDNAAYYFKKGFADLAEKPTISKIQGTIDLYIGQINGQQE